MASDIVITPNRGSTSVNAKIDFTGASTASSQIRLEVLPDNSLSFVGTAGSLFSIADSVTGSLMSVNDASGLPILEVFDTDKVVMGQYNQNTLVVNGTNVGIGTGSPTDKLTISNGNNAGLRFTGSNATITSASSNLIGVAANNIYMRPGSGYDLIVDVGNGINVTSGNIRAPAFYYSSDTNSRWVNGYQLYLRGTSPTIFFRDTDANSAMIHVNSNIFYILRAGNDTETWTQVNGRWPMEIDLTNNNMAIGGNLNVAAGTGTVTAATFSGALSGNATTATKWQTARSITIGNVGRALDGSADLTWTTSELGALSNSTSSTQDGYFGDIYLYDDSTPSHHLRITNSGNLTASNRTLSIDVNDAARTVSLSGNLTVSANATISGTNTGDQTTISGNAATATTLQTARNIAGVSFNGSADITLTGQNISTSSGTAANDIEVAKYLRWKNYGNNHILIDASAGTNPGGGAIDRYTPGNTINSTGAGSNTWGEAISLMGWNGSATYGVRVDRARSIDNQANSATITATSANTASQIVQRDGSGNFSAGTITAALSGNATTATTWQTARNFTIGSTARSVNGSSDYSWTVADIGAAVGLPAYQAWSFDSVKTPGLYQYDGAIGATKPPDGSANYRTIEVGSSTRYSQIALPWDSDNMYFRRQTNSTWSTWRTVLTDGNYNSYAPTLTGTGASGTWGISITGNAATATSADQIDGVAFRNTGSNAGTAADSLEQNGITYVNSNISLLGQTDGALFSQAYNSNWQHQIYGDYRTGQIVVRGKNNGTWQSWRTVLDSSNYTSYTGHIGNGTLTLNTSGSGISGSASFTANQSGNTTFTVTSNATVNNIASTIVYRGGSGEVYVGDAYSAGWFRNYGTAGLYNQDYGNHWYATGNDYWNLAGNNTGNIGIILRSGGHQGTIRGYVYADSSNNIGFLNNGGSWRLRAVGGDYILAEGSSIRGQLFYDSNDTNYYCDPASTSILNRLNVAGYPVRSSASIDMSNTSTYSTSNYYPVVINIPNGMPTRMRIVNALNSNVPSWSTHASGFTCHVEWTSNGSGWGTIAVNRTIERYTEGYTSSTICGGISQMTNGSMEVIYLRGGGIYLFESDGNVTPVAQSATYTNNGQSVSPTSTAVNNVWDAANNTMAVGYLRANTSIFIGGNTALHAGNYSSYAIARGGDTVNGAILFNSNKGSGVYLGSTNNPPLQVWSNDGGTAFMSFHRSGSYAVNMGLDPDQVFRIGGWSASSNRLQLDMSGNLWTASSMRTSIFYDQDDTNYYIDPASTSRVNAISFVSGATFGPYLQYSNQSNLRLQSGGVSSEVGLVGHDYYGNWRFQLYGSGAGYGFLNGNWAGWDIQKVTSGNLYLNAQSTYYIGTSEIYYNRVYGVTDIRSPIFYDNNDTAYWIDPTSGQANSEGGKIKWNFTVNAEGATSGRGLALYPSYTSSVPTYGITFAQTASLGTHGNVTSDWATYFTMNSTANRGWVFRVVDGTPANVASINNAGRMRIASLGVNTDASATNGEIRATDNITAYYSDERLKTKLGAIENPIEKVKSLSGFYFEANETAVALGYQKKREVGVSAQEVQAILPEIIAPAPIDEQYMTVRYEKLIPLLIEAIKEQQKQIEELKSLLSNNK